MYLHAGGRWRDIDSFGEDQGQLGDVVRQHFSSCIQTMTQPQIAEMHESCWALAIPCVDVHFVLAFAGPDLDHSWLTVHWQPLARCLCAAVSRIGSDSNPDRSVSILAHEMRTPLTSIKGYALSMLRRDVQWTADELHDFAQLIDDEADTLVRMVAEVLESSATRTGNLAVELEPTLIGKIVTAAVADFSARDPYHRYVLSVPPDLPAVLGDPMRIRQVLNNLLDNAGKYAVEGAVVVAAEEGPVEVVVSVADEGPGLKPEHLNRLFERFFRVKENGSRPVAGTGLGLPLARDLVERQHGRIWASSAEGHGTTVSFSLPKVME